MQAEYLTKIIPSITVCMGWYDYLNAGIIIWMQSPRKSAGGFKTPHNLNSAGCFHSLT